jgi:hypothetical protein
MIKDVIMRDMGSARHAATGALVAMPGSARHHRDGVAVGFDGQGKAARAGEEPGIERLDRVGIDVFALSGIRRAADQPVACIMAAMVAPRGRLNSASTAACLDLARVYRQALRHGIADLEHRTCVRTI